MNRTYWTNETLMERMRKLAADRNVSVIFDSGNIGADKEHRTIMMAGPTAYESPQWFVLCFLYELSHFILIDLIANKDMGAYADMMNRECQWRKEFWCWNNTLDLAYSVFGLQLNSHFAGMIHKCLGMYEDERGFAYINPQKEQDKNDN